MRKQIIHKDISYWITIDEAIHGLSNEHGYIAYVMETHEEPGAFLFGKAVDSAYRSQPFTTEAKRMEYLFELYEKYTADLFTKEKPKKAKTQPKLQNG